MSRRRLLASAACAAFMGSMLSGCAFFTVHGSSDGLDCSRSYGAPIIDGLVTAAVAGTIIATRNAAEDDCDEPGFGSCAIKESAFPLAFGGSFFALSSVYGVVQVGACRDQRGAVKRQLATLVERLGPVAEAGACEEVRRAVVVAIELGRDLGDAPRIDDPAVLRCLDERPTRSP